MSDPTNPTGGRVQETAPDQPEATDAQPPAGETADPAAAVPPQTAPEHHPEGVHSGATAEVDTDAHASAPAPALDPEEVAKVVAERDDLADQVLRARADYDNLNKRRLREVAEARDRGAASVVERLLEVLDNFGFALNAAAESSDTQLAKGVELVHGQLLQVLGEVGLQEVPGVGATFDPTHHEALISDDDEVEREEPEVAEVMRTGYRFKEQLLRPASVRVVS